MDYEACGVSEDSDRSVWGVSVDRRIQEKGSGECEVPERFASQRVQI